VTVEVRGSAVDSWVAQTYVYRGEVRSDRKVKRENQPWKKDCVMTAGTSGGVEPEKWKTASVLSTNVLAVGKINQKTTMNKTSVGVETMNGKGVDKMNTIHQEKFVWYACYGSNLSQTRFMKYISNCSDKTAPRESHSFQIPHRLYFGNKSRNWHNMSVAFLDPTKDQAETTLGRIYKVTVDQYLEVKKQEGPNYIYELSLGELEGIPIYTFTSPVLFRHDIPSNDYLDVIRIGLKETWPDMDSAEHDRYLQSHLCSKVDPCINQNDIALDSFVPFRDRDDKSHMARVGILRSIRSSPNAIAFKDIRKTVGSEEQILFGALQTLLEEGLIRTHAKYRFGMFNSETRYFTDPERRAVVDSFVNAP